jgi:hypothetical protein
MAVAQKLHKAASANSGKRVVTPRPLPPASLTFDIKPVPEAESKRKMVWDATYSAHGKTARFRLELVVIPPKEKGLIVPGSGCIYHVAGSESGGLLADLKPILGAKRVPTV